MKTFYLSVLVVMALLFAVQETTARAKGSFDRFRVLLKDGRRIEARDGVFTSDSLSATMSGGERLRIAREQIRAVDRYKGSQTGKGVMIGVGMGLLMFSMAYAQVEADPSMEVRGDRIVPVFMVLTLGGGLVGAVVGSTMKKWERVPLEMITTLDTSGYRKVVLAFHF